MCGDGVAGRIRTLGRKQGGGGSGMGFEYRGAKAARYGGGTAHFLLDDPMHILKEDAAIAHPTDLRAIRYLNGSLLAIEEVGFAPLHLQQAALFLFFRLLVARLL